MAVKRTIVTVGRNPKTGRFAKVSLGKKPRDVAKPRAVRAKIARMNGDEKKLCHWCGRYSNFSPSNDYGGLHFCQPLCRKQYINWERRGRKPARMSAMTLADHAEAWWREQGKTVPPRGSRQWNGMYRAWIGYAFKDFKKRR